MNITSSKTPVSVITGYLGAGKTTLLNYLLKNNKGKKLAVIVNEFGEIGIDSNLVISSDEEIIEMNNGCICCNIRGDLVRIIEKINNEYKKIDHIIIETTGLADPGPIIQSFWIEETLRSKTLLDGLITVVDSFHYFHHNESSESKEQIACADLIILNKIDLINNSEQKLLEESILRINPLANIINSNYSKVVESVFNVGGFDLGKVLKLKPLFLISQKHYHQKDIFAVCIENNDIVNGNLFNKWIYKYAQENGENLFRCKGILNIENQNRRFVFQGVHMTLEGRPGSPWLKNEKRINQIVFIGKDLDKDEINQGFNKCLHQSNQLV